MYICAVSKNRPAISSLFAGRSERICVSFFSAFPIRETLSHTIASLRQKHLLFQPFYYIFGLKWK